MIMEAEAAVEAEASRVASEAAFSRGERRKRVPILLRLGRRARNVILIYEEDETKAMETLRHEFLDYLVSRSAEPYQKIANLLIKAMNDEAYARKEKLVEVLAALI
jgi:hypothetical protein